MSYEVFKSRIERLIAKSGSKESVRFPNDIEKGRFLAFLSSGDVITGHPSSLKVTVNFASGHKAMAVLPA